MTSTISRRQILSRSRDAGLDRFRQKQQQRQNHFAPYEDYEEMWFSHEHLFKDHIAEVLRKWEQIDDEIWAKMIFMSRNRRIAKAYVRVPAVIIDGTDNGFDGYRVGLNGFEDPFRDSQTDQLMNHIEKGCRIGIDDSGDILIKRYSQSKVFVKSYPLDFSRSCVDNSVIRANGCLEPFKKYVLFDMAKFEVAMMEELKSAYPDRSKLEQQCIVIIGFVRDHADSILDMPIYVMLINIVALDMLKSKLNPIIYQSVSHRKQTQVPEFVSIFNQLDSDCCNEKEDPIYGQIVDFDGTWNGTDEYQMENRVHHNRHRTHLQECEPQSLPTLNKIRQFPFSQEYSSETIHSSKPPKLPPRDKKKLSKQINTIKNTRKHQNKLSSIEIPSPDYHDYDRDEMDRSSGSFYNRSNRRCNPFDGNITSRATTKASTAENIYGTIVNKNNGGDHFGRRYMPKRGQHNWPLSSSSSDRCRRSGRSMMPSTCMSSMQLLNGNNTLTPFNSSGSFSSTNINRSLRAAGDAPSNLFQVDDDPYYSGLEARVTSNKLRNSSTEHRSKMKGLNWMMRKVLSSNYINILTSKRHKKKVPKSKSSNESSTDSDPYVSINDVYEPIYEMSNGRTIYYEWPNMQTRSNHF